MTTVKILMLACLASYDIVGGSPPPPLSMSFSEFLSDRIGNGGQIHQKHDLFSPRDLIEDFDIWRKDPSHQFEKKASSAQDQELLDSLEGPSSHVRRAALLPSESEWVPLNVDRANPASFRYPSRFPFKGGSMMTNDRPRKLPTSLRQQTPIKRRASYTSSDSFRRRNKIQSPNFDSFSFRNPADLETYHKFELKPVSSFETIKLTQSQYDSLETLPQGDEKPRRSRPKFPWSSLSGRDEKRSRYDLPNVRDQAFFDSAVESAKKTYFDSAHEPNYPVNPFDSRFFDFDDDPFLPLAFQKRPSEIGFDSPIPPNRYSIEVEFPSFTDPSEYSRYDDSKKQSKNSGSEAKEDIHSRQKNYSPSSSWRKKDDYPDNPTTKAPPRFGYDEDLYERSDNGRNPRDPSKIESDNPSYGFRKLFEGKSRKPEYTKEVSYFDEPSDEKPKGLDISPRDVVKTYYFKAPDGEKSSREKEEIPHKRNYRRKSSSFESRELVDHYPKDAPPPSVETTTKKYVPSRKLRKQMILSTTTESPSRKQPKSQSQESERNFRPTRRTTPKRRRKITTTTTEKTVDDLSVHHLAGPPYHDSISVDSAEYSTEYGSSSTTEKSDSHEFHDKDYSSTKEREPYSDAGRKKPDRQNFRKTYSKYKESKPRSTESAQKSNKNDFFNTDSFFGSKSEDFFDGIKSFEMDFSLNSREFPTKAYDDPWHEYHRNHRFDEPKTPIGEEIKFSPRDPYVPPAFREESDVFSADGDLLQDFDRKIEHVKLDNLEEFVPEFPVKDKPVSRRLNRWHRRQEAAAAAAAVRNNFGGGGSRVPHNFEGPHRVGGVASQEINFRPKQPPFVAPYEMHAVPPISIEDLTLRRGLRPRRRRPDRGGDREGDEEQSWGIGNLFSLPDSLGNLFGRK